MNQELCARAARIKAILTDVDGILTDGKLNFFTLPDGRVDEFKSFNALDGLGARMCRSCGLTLGIITGRRHPSTIYRAKALGFAYIYQGFLTKTGPLEDILKRENLTAEEVAFIGDDLTDLPLLRRVGLAVTVPNAVDAVKQSAHYITTRAGGSGAYREMTDLILTAQGKMEPLLEQINASGWAQVPTAELQIITSAEGIN